MHCATASMSNASSISTMPCASQTASSTAWDPARLAVCDLTARAPDSVRPAFAMSTGLPFARARSTAARNRSVDSNPSTYRQIACVAGSSAM